MDWIFTIKWLLSTVGVLGLVFLIFYLSGRNYKRKGRDLEIIEGLPLGNRQGIYLIRAKDRILVVGISNNGMQVLSEFTSQKPEEDKNVAATKEGN